MQDLEVLAKEIDIRWQIFYDEDMPPKIVFWINDEQITPTDFGQIEKILVRHVAKKILEARIETIQWCLGANMDSKSVKILNDLMDTITWQLKELEGK